MKLIAITLTALFLTSAVAPADAALSRTKTVRTYLIPGAAGCCG